MNVSPEVDDTVSTLEGDRGFDVADGPRPATTWQAWLETLVLAALATAVGIHIEVGLPWLALAPLMAGLRYGSLLGVACAAAQATALMVLPSPAHADATIDVPDAEALLGWLIAGLLTGQFRDAWTRRLHRLETRAQDARSRLGALARAYHLLAASHDRIQREIPGSPSSLRDALQAFAREAVESEGGTIESLGTRILNLFRVHASVRAATLHRVDGMGRAGPAVAALGTGTACEDDPLIRQAVRLGEVVSVRDLAETAGTLAAVPLVDLAGRVHGVVAVRELPFLSLHQDTLTLLAVLGGHFGDIMARANEVTRGEVENQPTRAFCASVSRSLRQARAHGIPAALAIVDLEAVQGKPHVARLLARGLAAHRRVTDEAQIVVDDDGNLRILFLLKLAGESGLRCYLARLAELARARAHELDIPCQIGVRGWSLDDAPLPTHLQQLELGVASLLRKARSEPLDAVQPAESSAKAETRRHRGVVA